MAVLKNIVLAASVLAPLVAAVPMFGPDKRAIYTDTVTEIAWVTIEETTTIWVDQDAATPAPVAPAATTSSVPAVVSVEATYTPSTLATVAAAPQQPPSSSPTVAPAAAYTAPAASAPAPVASSSVVPVPASAPSSSLASLIAPATMTLQPKATVGTDGDCEGSDDACQGDITHWDGGLGACGWNVDTNSDMEIALPYEFMGTQSNGNPYCGRSVTLYNPATGNSVQATVGDKCMGCLNRAIDCTDALFNAIAPGGDGRVSGIEWWLN